MTPTSSFTHDQLEALDKECLIAIVLALQDAIVLLQEQVARLEVDNQALRDQLAKNSRNSGKPPASDGYVKPSPKSLRPKGQRPSGGQPGHKGHTLRMVSQPDAVVSLPVDSCPHCQTALTDVPTESVERRQVFDLPPARLEVTEYRADVKCCPGCGQQTKGTFPDGVTQPTQYGSRVRALSAYLNAYQLLPLERITELFRDLFGHEPSESLILSANEAVAQQVSPTVEAIRTQLTGSEVAHFDETGLRVEGKLHWLHTVGTPWLTYYAVHPMRGEEAMRHIGILPAFGGRAVHDGWASYFRFDHCAHAWCNAHPLRELRFIEEQYRQRWARVLSRLLRRIKREVDASPPDRTCLSPERCAAFERRYETCLQSGYAANPPPEPSGKRGRPKQSAARNLLDRLRTHKDAVLAFMRDFRVPFDNNVAERDVRMMKVKQKVSGAFRTRTGATTFCAIRGYISTVRKHGGIVLQALESALIGQPFIPTLAGRAE